MQRAYVLNMFKTMIVLAGLVQLAIAFTSMAIPRLLDWPRELALLRPLTRSIFWTYAGYILGIHFWFATLALGWSSQLLAGTPLAALVTGFISIYWLVRIVGQFTWYDRSVANDRALFRAAQVLYVSGFAFITVVFGAAALHNLRMVIP
jgi:hypothetical protein